MFELASGILKDWFILLKMLLRDVAYMITHPREIRFVSTTDRRRNMNVRYKPYNSLNYMDPQNFVEPDNPISPTNTMSPSSPEYDSHHNRASWEN